MKKLAAMEFITLDGFMVGENEDMNWVIDLFNDELGREIKRQQALADTLVYGRITYEIMAAYWPNVKIDASYDETKPAEGSEDPEITRYMNNTPKVVFTRTIKKADWNNTRLVRSNLKEEIIRLKQQQGKALAIVGSASIVQICTNLGLLDEYWLLQFPVLLGRGKPLFKNLESKRNLKLLESKTFSNGVVGINYQVTT